MRDLKTHIGPVLLKEPTDLVATTTKSALLDRQNFDAVSILVVISALTGVDGSNYLVPSLQHSDTTVDGDFADVDAVEVLGAFTKVDAVAEDSVIQHVGYLGNKRYVRAVITYTGTGITAGVVGVIGIVANPNLWPVVAPAAVAAT